MASTPPRAMTAPASTPKTKVAPAGAVAFETPVDRTAAAISRGVNSSTPDIGPDDASDIGAGRRFVRDRAVCTWRSFRPAPRPT